MKRILSIMVVMLVIAGGLGITQPASVSAGGADLTVGPGQEYETIQAAVDDARQGDTILVYPGFYEESVLVTTDHLQIIAAGDGVTVFSPIGGTAPFVVHADHVTVRGFNELTGIEDCVPGIQFEGSHNRFADNVINPGSCPGVNALVCRDADGGSNFNTIENNTIVHSDLGIVMTSVPTTTTALNIGNVIRNNTLNGMAAAGIVVQNGYGFTISGNSIPGSEFGHCITVGADNDTPQGHHLITNNQIAGCAGYGIALWADHETSFIHNRITNNEVSFSHHGINLYADPEATIRHTLIKGNTIYHNAWNGIVLEPGAEENILLKNTVVTHINDGIQVLGDDNKIIQNSATGNVNWDLADWGTDNKWLGNEYGTASWE